jgi:hypothetical protein
MKSSFAVLVLAVLAASSTLGLKIQLANSSTSGVTIVPLGDSASPAQADAQAPSSASAAPALVHAAVNSQGDVAPLTVTAIPSDGSDSDAERGQEHLQAHTDVETMRSILASLPEPEPDVVDALNRPGISDAELRIILRRVWDKRQAMLKQYMDSIKTDADFMKTLIERLMVPGVVAGPEDSEGSEDDPRVSVLEDLEYHVGKADNAKDFKTVGAMQLC